MEDKELEEIKDYILYDQFKSDNTNNPTLEAANRIPIGTFVYNNEIKSQEIPQIDDFINSLNIQDFKRILDWLRNTRIGLAISESHGIIPQFVDSLGSTLIKIFNLKTGENYAK